jgi:hypothetical protein
MQVGDLVCHVRKENQVGIVIATGKWAGNADVQVKWLAPSWVVGTEPIQVHNSKFLKALTSS